MGGDDYKLMPGARRFDLGNYNYAGAAAAHASMAELPRSAPSASSATSPASRTRSRSGMLDLDLPVPAARPARTSRNIVTVGALSDNHYGADDERIQGLYEHLVENHVKLSIRRGTLRFALPPLQQPGRRRARARA